MSCSEKASRATVLVEDAIVRTVIQSTNIGSFWRYVKGVTLESHSEADNIPRRALLDALADPPTDAGEPKRSSMRIVDNYAEMVDRAAIVFIHSVVDDILMALCRAVAEFKPEGFYKQIEAKKVPFSSVVSGCIREVGRDLVTEHLSPLERDSVVTKAGCLTAACKALKGDLTGYDLSYSASSLESLNEVRKGIVHKGEGIPEGMDVGEFIDSAIDIMLHFAGLVAIACEIPIDLDTSTLGEMCKGIRRQRK